MRERGKAVNDFPEFNFSDIQCKKHPNSTSVGICAYCLKDRLVKLVCSECGEQRLSSCSCSDVSSSYRNSCSTEIGSVGRVSFLIENEKDKDKGDQSYPHPKPRKEAEQVIFLRRSSSSCVQVKKSNGFWKIKRLFRKKRDKGCDNYDDKSEVWVSDNMGVSRSRSLCSFRNGFRNDLDSGSDCAFSSAKISDVTGGIFLDSDKQFGFESEARRSGFRDAEHVSDSRWQRRSLDRTYSVPNRGVFPAKESDFNAMDESAFIDLKLDLSSEPRISGASNDHGFSCKNDQSFESGGSLASLKSNGVGSCRITANERGLKRGSKSHKVWKWIFKYHPGK
ncbi:hypothetical protein ACS0TY_009779 [Phlomoides rotata]